MIHFFRRIRQGLLSQNRFSKYMLYAIGEILLVVVGILIALSINNWNEKRKSDILKETYTKQLVNNLEKDIIQLEEYLDLNNFFDNESFYLLDYLVKRNKNPDYSWLQT